MFNFTAHFFDNKIYINKQFVYNNNQFLTELLNFYVIQNLEDYYETLIRNSHKLTLFSNLSTYEIENYNSIVQKIHRVFKNLDDLFSMLSISKIISTEEKIHSDKLFDILNSVEWIWEYYDVDKHPDKRKDSDFGYSETYFDSYGNEDKKFTLTRFIPSELEYSVSHSSMDEELQALNDKIADLCNEYLTFTEDILRVKELYVDFINNYLNAENKFLDANSLANAYASFIENTKKLSERNYHKFTSGYSKFSHTVIEDNNKSLLCQSYDFQSIGAFLYFDLFRGIENNYIPRKCDSCGTYFLIKAGKYTSYCDNISPSDDTKTCKEIGSRKRYDDKCKTDPVWQTYNRAYKAHYARYMKKKMTVSEFGKWSDWAIEWRTKAENEEIDFEEYVREIKK